jgi:dihydrofolate reductase
MGNVVIDMSMSLDGYIAAPNDNPQQGLGEDGMRLHNWAFDDPSVFERVFGNLIEETGAVIMGRRTYDNSIEAWSGKGPLDDVACFVVTHRAFEPASPVFTVVTDGIEGALALARDTAGDKTDRAHGCQPRSAIPRGGARGRDQDPPRRCPARWRASAVRRAPAAARAGTDRAQPDGRRDASRVPRPAVARPAVEVADGGRSSTTGRSI